MEASFGTHVAQKKASERVWKHLRVEGAARTKASGGTESGHLRAESRPAREPSQQVASQGVSSERSLGPGPTGHGAEGLWNLSRSRGKPVEAAVQRGLELGGLF